MHRHLSLLDKLCSHKKQFAFMMHITNHNSIWKCEALCLHKRAHPVSTLRSY